MDLDQLRTFLLVLDRGSFTLAAQALHIGQSTVSFHIKALESAAGARLLDRRGGRVRPTAAGRVLSRYASRLCALRDEALARVRAEEIGDAGSLVIAASTIPGEYLLPDALAQLRRLHPRVAIQVDISDSRRALSQLLDQECDLALIGSVARRDARVTLTPLCDDEVVLVGARAGKVDLSRASLVLRERGSGTQDAVARLLPTRAPDARAPLVVFSRAEPSPRMSPPAGWPFCPCQERRFAAAFTPRGYAARLRPQPCARSSG